MLRLPVLFLLVTVTACAAQNTPRVSGSDVDLALLRFAATQDAEDLAHAQRLALETIPETDDPAGRIFVSPEPLLRVAHAGGKTLAQAEILLGHLESLIEDMGTRGTTDANAQLIRCLFLHAQASENPAVLDQAIIKADAFIRSRVIQTPTGVRLVPGGSQATEPSLLDYIETLGVLLEVAATAPQVADASLVQALAHELVETFWDETLGCLRPHAIDTAMMGPPAIPFLNARAIRGLWFAGHMTGDTFLSHRAKRIAKAIRKEGTAPSMFKADVELALAVLETVPVGVFIVGEARDPQMQRMRQDAFMAFEPLKVIVNLDPQRERDHLTALKLLGTVGVSVGFFSPEASYTTPKVEGRRGIEDACIKVRRQL